MLKNTNFKQTDQLLKRLATWRQAATDIQDIILANLVMLSETTALSGGEQARLDLWLRRLIENGAQSCSLDEAGNGCGILPGQTGKHTILLATNADSLPADAAERGIEVKSNSVTGPFVGDNSPALAALLSLPVLLERMGLHLKSDLAVMGAARSFGHYNLEGARFFLNNTSLKIDAGVWLESVQLGRLNYNCLGLLRGEIICRVPDDYKWAQQGATGSILPMNDIITRISQISLPHRPLTGIVFGSINGGLDYQNIAKQTRLRFEVRSESEELVLTVQNQIRDIVDEVAAMSGMSIVFRQVASRRAGGLEIAHPLVKNARNIISALGMQPMMYPTTTALSAFIDAQIPAITLGFTTGERKDELGETGEEISIPNMFTGLAQLIAILSAIDVDFQHDE